MAEIRIFVPFVFLSITVLIMCARSYQIPDFPSVENRRQLKSLSSLYGGDIQLPSIRSPHTWRHTWNIYNTLVTTPIKATSETTIRQMNVESSREILHSKPIISEITPESSVNSVDMKKVLINFVQDASRSSFNDKKRFLKIWNLTKKTKHVSVTSTAEKVFRLNVDNFGVLTPEVETTQNENIKTSNINHQANIDNESGVKAVVGSKMELEEAVLNSTKNASMFNARNNKYIQGDIYKKQYKGDLFVDKIALKTMQLKTQLRFLKTNTGHKRNRRNAQSENSYIEEKANLTESTSVSEDMFMQLATSGTSPSGTLSVTDIEESNEENSKINTRDWLENNVNVKNFENKVVVSTDAIDTSTSLSEKSDIANTPDINRIENTHILGQGEVTEYTTASKMSDSFNTIRTDHNDIHHSTVDSSFSVTIPSITTHHYSNKNNNGTVFLTNTTKIPLPTETIPEDSQNQRIVDYSTTLIPDFDVNGIKSETLGSDTNFGTVEQDGVTLSSPDNGNRDEDATDSTPFGNRDADVTDSTTFGMDESDIAIRTTTVQNENKIIKQEFSKDVNFVSSTVDFSDSSFTTSLSNFSTGSSDMSFVIPPHTSSFHASDTSSTTPPVDDSDMSSTTPPVDSTVTSLTTPPVDTTDTSSTTLPVESTDMSLSTLPVDTTDTSTSLTTLPVESTDMSLTTLPIESTDMSLTTLPVESTDTSLTTLPVESTDTSLTTLPVESTDTSLTTLPVESTDTRIITLPVESTDTSLTTLPVESTDTSLTTLPIESTDMSLTTLPVESTDTSLTTLPVESTDTSLTTLPVESTDTSLTTLPVESTDTRIITLPVESTDTSSTNSLISSSLGSSKTTFPAPPANPNVDSTTLTFNPPTATEYLPTRTTSFSMNPTANTDERSDNDSIAATESEDRSFIFPLTESGPDWELAKQTWQFAWEIHIYVFGSLFGLIGLYTTLSLFRLWWIHCLFSNGYFISLHCMIVLMCATRSFYLLYDGYGSGGTFNAGLNHFLYNISFVCLTSAFSVLFYSLMKITHVRLVPRSIQKLQVLIFIILVHFLVSLAADVLISVDIEVQIMLFMCHLYFITWGLFLFFGYVCIFPKLCSHASKRQEDVIYSTPSSFSNTETMKNALTVSVAVKVLLCTALCGLLVVGLEIYAIIEVYKTFTLGHPDPWTWWLYHTGLRMLEFVMCLTMSYVASLPLRYRRSNNKRRCGILCAPCSEIVRCGCCKTKDQNNGTDFNHFDQTSNCLSIYNENGDNLTENSSKKLLYNQLNDIIPTFDIQPSIDSRRNSLLIIEDGYVRFQTDYDINRIVDSCNDLSQRPADVHSVSTFLRRDGVVNTGYSLNSREDKDKYNNNYVDGALTDKSRKSSMTNSDFFMSGSSVSIADSMENELVKAFESFKIKAKIEKNTENRSDYNDVPSNFQTNEEIDSVSATSNLEPRTNIDIVPHEQSKRNYGSNENVLQGHSSNHHLVTFPRRAKFPEISKTLKSREFLSNPNLQQKQPHSFRKGDTSQFTKEGSSSHKTAPLLDNEKRDNHLLNTEDSDSDVDVDFPMLTRRPSEGHGSQAAVLTSLLKSRESTSNENIDV